MLGDITDEHVDYMVARIPSGRLGDADEASALIAAWRPRTCRSRPAPASTSRAAGDVLCRALDAAHVPAPAGLRRPCAASRTGGRPGVVDRAGREARPARRCRRARRPRARRPGRALRAPRPARPRDPRPARALGAARAARPARDVGGGRDVRDLPRRPLGTSQSTRNRTSTASSTTPSGPRSSSRTPPRGARSARAGRSPCARTRTGPSPSRRSRSCSAAPARGRGDDRQRRLGRDIEGANPLYLPQAKVYARACALGPAVLVPEDWDAPFTIGLRISDEAGATCSRARPHGAHEARRSPSSSTGCTATTPSRRAACCSPAPASCRPRSTRSPPGTRWRSRFRGSGGS